MAAETMAVTRGKTVSSDITKLRQDVLKQAIASLASFIGGVNYSDSFHMAAKAQGRRGGPQEAPGGVMKPGAEPEEEGGPSKGVDNPLYDITRMNCAVQHANSTTNSYGVMILSINILSAIPVDRQLTTALASGAVASAQALQAETAARGNAKAVRIDAEAAAEKARIESEGVAQAATLVAEGSKK